MALKLNTAPTVEPISLAEAKAHLRIDSESLADNIVTEISIAPGSHAVAASYSLEGTSVEVSGYSVLVNLVAGTCGSGGTVDVKLQESTDDTNWSDVSGGAFTQVTEANDNAVQEKAYTGAYQYLRAVATVGTAACEFSVEVIKKSGPATEDDVLDIMIAAARQDCEKFQSRAYITQTWELWLDAWPKKGHLMIPLPPLQSITSIKYYDVDNAPSTFSSAEYYVDTKNEPGWVVLNYGSSWPTGTLRPANGVCITFVGGYGDAGSDVPKNIRQAILLLLGHYYEHREDVITGAVVTPLPRGAESLLWKDRVF